MAKILLLAQGEYVARYAEPLQKQLLQPDELEVIVAHMEDAVRIARRYVGAGTEVVIARGTTASMLREAEIPVSVVEIPISNDEIHTSIEKARAIAAPGSPIGFLGFQNAVRSRLPFLKHLDIPINLYEVNSSTHNLEQIRQAKKDGVTVLIGGERSMRAIGETGIRSVLMETSFNSVSAAYQQAREILNALAMEKKKNRETITIFDSVSDAIMSLDADCRVAMCNRRAGDILGQPPQALAGRGFEAFFSEREQADIRQVMRTGEEMIGAIIERPGSKYAMRIVPVIVDGHPDGAVVTLQEIKALQRMEATVRKGLYEKGNVARYVFGDIKGGSGAVRDAVEMARSFARLHSNVLIVGETGTGKELFAQSIHNASVRRDRPFVAVNCGAIPPNLVESELFGYEDGAFTGSKKGGKMGLFEMAHTGTIFLDEISEMDHAGQVNLLRALQEGQIRRVGGGNPVPVDVRVVAACNANLHDMVRDNRFRRDLYYRLSVLVMKVPALRERAGDVSRLAAHFVEDYNRQFGKSVSLSEAALRQLESYAWDGNIRQLRNFCERLTAIAEEPVADSAFVHRQFTSSFWHDAPAQSSAAPTLPPEAHAEREEGGKSIMVRGRLHSRIQLERLLAKHRGSREAVAGELGMSRTTLWKLLKKLDF